MAILGIDVGKNGGFAILDGDLITLVTGNDLGLLSELIRSHPPKHVFIEKAQAMPKQGVSAMFNYGVTFGKLIGFVEARMLPYTLVAPHIWMKTMLMGTSGEGKARAGQAAKRLFPQVDLFEGPRSRKPHDGVVDALLLAEWGRRSLR